MDPETIDELQLLDKVELIEKHFGQQMSCLKLRKDLSTDQYNK